MAKLTERSLKGKGGGAGIGIVRKISLMVRMGSNPSGSRPNFFGRQHLTFDKGGKYCGGSLYAVVMNRRNIRRGVGLPLPKYHCNYQKQVNRIIM